MELVLIFKAGFLKQLPMRANEVCEKSRDRANATSRAVHADTRLD